MQVAQGCGYGRSLFERLCGVDHPVHLLDVQYRMHPEISAFPNAQFYGGKIQDGDNVWKGRYNTEPCQQIFSGPYKFINIREGREQRDEGQTKSWKNLLEVEIVVLLISRIHKGKLISATVVMGPCMHTQFDTWSIFRPSTTCDLHYFSISLGSSLLSSHLLLVTKVVPDIIKF